MKDADALKQEFDERRKRDSKRIDEYRRMVAPYFGDEEEGPRGRVQASYADGRAALRYTSDGADDSKQNDVLNLIPQIVDSIVAVRGVNPTHTVKPENTDPAGLEQQLKRTRALREQHQHSGMTIQGAQLAFYLAAMGDGCFVLNPRLKADIEAEKKRDKFVNPFLPEGVYITVVNPSQAFPKFRIGVPGNEIEDVFCYWESEGEEIEATYGRNVGSGTKQVIHYYSRSEKRIICEGKDLIEPVRHELGFCPAVWCFNKANDGRSAQSEIRMAIGMNAQLGLVYDIWLDSLIWAVHPIIHVHDREYVATPSESPEIGPGATVSTKQTGKVELLSPQGHPEVASKMMETLVDSLHQVTGVSPIQTQGIIDKSNVSARSVSQQQSPMEHRLMLSNLLLSESYMQLNARILLMLSHLKAFKGTQFPLYGEDKLGVYNDTFTGDDIGGWVRTATKWDATLGTSRHELLAMVLQVYKESIITGQPYRYPFRLVLESIGIEDPQAVMQEALSEAETAAKAAQKMQPQQPPGAPGQQGGDPTQMIQDASALQQGGQAAAGPPGGGPVQPGAPAPPTGENGAGPPSIPGFPPVAAAPSRAGMGNPAEVPDIGKMVSEAIGGLRLHGEIVSVTGGTGNSIHITVSDHRDVAQVRQAVEAVAGGMKVVVKPASPSSKIPASSNGRSR